MTTHFARKLASVIQDCVRANALRAPRHSGSAPSRQSSLPSRPFGECRLSRETCNG
jgi:hypothetical protein